MGTVKVTNSTKKSEHILVLLENMEKVTLVVMEIGTSYYK